MRLLDRPRALFLDSFLGLHNGRFLRSTPHKTASTAFWEIWIQASVFSELVCSLSGARRHTTPTSMTHGRLGAQRSTMSCIMRSMRRGVRSKWLQKSERWWIRPIFFSCAEEPPSVLVCEAMRPFAAVHDFTFLFASASTKQWCTLESNALLR